MQIKSKYKLDDNNLQKSRIKKITQKPYQHLKGYEIWVTNDALSFASS